VLQTSARLLRLLSFFQARRYWPGAELCERLEVTPRTLRRDVDRLRSLGYPVNSSSGVAGGYQLGAGATLPPLLLDDEEAVAVAVGLRTSSACSIAGVEESSLRALTKLEQVLPARLRRRVGALHSFITPLIAFGPSIDVQMISIIAAACRDQNILHFQYRSREGSETTRTAEPHQLVHTGSRWYLVAWDTNRENWRTFRVDRIQQPKPAAGTRFKPRAEPEGGFAAYVSRSVSDAPYSHHARVVLHANAKVIAQRIPPTAGTLESLSEDRCLLTTGAHSLDMLCILLALAGVDFEIREPAELVAHMAQLKDRFERALALSTLSR
jgi:predicted DNA-binding transcriptional regulator YafY